MITPGNCDKAEFATKLRKSCSLQNTWFQYCSANVSSYNATIQRMIQAHIWKRDQENIFTCVEVRGRTSGTHTAVARLASALASGHLSFGKISHKIFQISESGVKVRSKGKGKRYCPTKTSVCWPTAGRRGSRNILHLPYFFPPPRDVWLTCSDSCETAHQVLGLCSTAKSNNSTQSKLGWPCCTAFRKTISKNSESNYATRVSPSKSLNCIRRTKVILISWKISITIDEISGWSKPNDEMLQSSS